MSFAILLAIGLGSILVIGTTFTVLENRILKQA